MNKTHLYMADVRAIRREMALVEAQLAHYERNPEALGAGLRVGFTMYALGRALARAEKAMRRYDRHALEHGGAP